MARKGAVFDVMGTLFDLESLRPRFIEVGAPGAALEAWFGRALHSATSLTLADEFRPFSDIAGSTIRTTLAQFDCDPDRGQEVIAGLSVLEPYPDAAAALNKLKEAGVDLITLTNGTEENTRILLEGAGLADHFNAVVTCAEVAAYKPHPAPYARAAEELGLPKVEITMIAAHAWDVVGARKAGLGAIWVDRTEREWPLPVDPVVRAADLEEAAELLLG